MIKKLTSLLVSLLFLATSYAEPQKVIFDTDMGNDIDDALALAMLYGYVDSKDIDLLAIAINKDNPYSPVFINILADYYGKGNVPIYMVENGVTKDDGLFARRTCDMKNSDGTYVFARRLDKDSKLTNAVDGLRKTLASAPDSSIVYISVGFSTNFASLLQSKGDEISPLSGMELFKKKVKYASIMAGEFKKNLSFPTKRYGEYNVDKDIDAAKYVFENCPVPIVFSGFEIGIAVEYPHSQVDKLGKANPISSAYDAYAKHCDKKTGRHNRPSWDLTSVLYVVNPDVFDISENGDVVVDLSDKSKKHAYTIFKPSKDGTRRYLKMKDSNVVVDELVKAVNAANPKKP